MSFFSLTTLAQYVCLLTVRYHGKHILHSQMSGHRWAECVTAVTAIVNKAVDCGAIGIELHFFNSHAIFNLKQQAGVC